MEHSWGLTLTAPVLGHGRAVVGIRERLKTRSQSSEAGEAGFSEPRPQVKAPRLSIDSPIVPLPFNAVVCWRSF